MVNNSRNVKTVNVSATIGHERVIDQQLTYSGKTPDYTTWVKSYNKGVYKIKVTMGNITKFDTLDLYKDIYVYISYDATIKGDADTTEGVAIYKTYTEYEHY